MNKKKIVLSGNPNVGKTSIFNLLTGMHQHTGNWSGKTVAVMDGYYKKNKSIQMVDLPGTYSLMHLSEEELLARDALIFDDYDLNIVVCNSCNLERNMNLLLQILEINKNAVVVLNLDDVAQKNSIFIDEKKLEGILGVKVVKCSVKKKSGIEDLVTCFDKNNINSKIKISYGNYINGKIEELEELLSKYDLNMNRRFIALKLLEGDKTIIKSIKEKNGIDILDSEVNEFLTGINFNDSMNVICGTLNKLSEEICKRVVKKEESHLKKTMKIDRIITTKRYGVPLSLLFLALIFYLTLQGANYPGIALSSMFNFLEGKLMDLALYLNVPKCIYSPLILGVFKTVGWVVSVMLPPMAIFFPLFALGEESGVLPRIAFNFDRVFKKCRAHGKQALTMCMGFGCNACAVIGARIIDSPRDRIVAILTNNFVPCNGRFPFLIAVITMFFVGTAGFTRGILAALILTGLIILGMILSLLISKVLSHTLLKGVPSHFTLELPSFKKPKIGTTILRTLFDKTLFVLMRAVKVAAPAGLIIWIFANINVGGTSILEHTANFFDPFAQVLGLDGFILLAFILALPANEILFPIIIMSYLATGTMTEMSNLTELKQLLVNNGWTWITALNVCLFSLIHFPCGTTLLTIKKEIGKKWMFYAFLIPTITGLIIIFLTNLFFTRIF